MRKEPVLVTGATGYVGGRLIPQLLAAGYRVRAFGRSIEKLKCRPWGDHPNVELAQGDVMDPESLKRAAAGCWAAYYLVHSMITQEHRFAEADRKAAQNMADAASSAGIERIIYLGGLGDMTNTQISEHLRSRYEVGKILQAGPVPTTILRAAMILGSGSASFEILRYLVDRLPVMITPKWVDTPCQPISIVNVLNYLQGCLESNEVIGETFDIGGPEVFTYRDIIQIYAQEAGLSQRFIIPVPFLTPTLSAYWIHLITPVPASIAVPLTKGLSVPVTCQDQRIRKILPQKLNTCREAIRTALDRLQQEKVDTCWMDAGASLPPEWAYCGDSTYGGGTILECSYRIRLTATLEDVWDPIRKIGGKTGWYFGNRLWWVRGAVDRLLGGFGLRRGRRHPSDLRVGDALDFWRVLEVTPPSQLLLLAEMKLPGEALLEFKINPLENGQTELQQRIRFLPRGLAGILYWHLSYPFHTWIFKGMVKAIAKTIEKQDTVIPERFSSNDSNTCTLPQNKS